MNHYLPNSSLRLFVDKEIKPKFKVIPPAFLPSISLHRSPRTGDSQPRERSSIPTPSFPDAGPTPPPSSFQYFRAGGPKSARRSCDVVLPMVILYPDDGVSSEKSRVIPCPGFWSYQR